MSFFLTPAYAQAAGHTGGGFDMIVQFAPIGIVLVIMYFLVLRPQQSRAREHQTLIKNVRRGDTIVTTGGLVGKVTKVIDDNEIELEIAQGMRVRQVRQMISDVRSKGEPVKESP